MENEKYCVMRSGGQGYALPATVIRYVTPTPTIFPAPQTDPTMSGICHLRNEFLAVVDLNLLARIGDPHDDRQRSKRQLAALSSMQGNWGLLVDEVQTLASLEHTTHGDADRRGFASAIIGSATHNGQFLSVLDPNRLYKLVEDRLRAAWAAMVSANTLNYC